MSRMLVELQCLDLLIKSRVCVCVAVWCVTSARRNSTNRRGGTSRWYRGKKAYPQNGPLTFRVSHRFCITQHALLMQYWVNSCCCVSPQERLSACVRCFVCGHWSHVPAGLIIIPADGFSWVYCISFQGDRLSQSLPWGDTERVCVCSAHWRLSGQHTDVFPGIM